MAEPIALSRDDYENSIARIFHQNGNVVGTGFLVAPGYVLTCTHVVLQALGFNSDDFEAAPNPEGQIVSLAFLAANGAKLEAKVLCTLPYQIDSGDVAGLKLLGAAPTLSKPIPIIRCQCEEIQNHRHAVYGFADDGGGRTDAYKPKANASGWRFLLSKGADLQDETIEAGFSGAPVWNDELKAAVGMVATAMLSNKSEISKAYAIREEALNPILQILFAHSLYDCIQPHLQSNRQKIQPAIDTAFWLCDTDGNQANSDDLLDRLKYVADLPNREWYDKDQEIDRLTQFAIFLNLMDDLPQALRDEIKAWVAYRRFDYNALYVKADDYRRERQVSSSYAPAHLMVQIKPDEQDARNVCVSIWVVRDRDSYDPLEPEPHRVLDKKVAFAKLPTFLETWLEEESDLDEPMLHCFVARRLLGWDLDARRTDSGLTLGSQYKLAMRTDLSQSPTGKQYHTRWQKNWQSLEIKHQSFARNVFVRSCCRDRQSLHRQLRNVEMAILDNLATADFETVFQFLAKKVAVPVVLWVRQAEFSEELDSILDCTVINLPERIFEERSNATDETCLGYHLSLVWEDPKIIPPTMVMPLDQQVC